MTRSQSPGGVPTQEVAAYYRSRAEGGVGLIVTEGTTIDHPAANGYPRVPRIHGQDALEGWRNVVREVHAAGGHIIPQIWHVGSQRQPGTEPDPSVPGVGPSAVLHPSCRGKGELPRVLEEPEILSIIDAFGRAAAAARDVGFDGVEIHGAHAYLIDQFLWEKTNQRTDGWGGSMEARSRFATDAVRAVRAAVGPDFPVVFRWSQWKLGAYDAKLAASPAELERFLAPLADAGVDIFHCSQRRFWEPEFRDSDLNLAGWTTKLTGLPSITVGSVGLEGDFITTFAGGKATPAGLEQLERRMGDGEMDLVAVGRALLSDPEWADKVREGRLDEIRPFDPADMKRLVI